MARHRFFPLVLIVALGAFALVARLFQVQIHEGEVWAGQAASLVRAGSVRPYERGAIRDARGREIAHDEASYRVEFRYRDFRRGHPLGLVTHARSALLGTPVPLSEGLVHLSEWADELVDLCPSDLDLFARGEMLRLPSVEIPGCARSECEREDRFARRTDARFYTMQLFGLDNAAAAKLNKSLVEHADTPLIELASVAVGGIAPAELRKRMHTRLHACTEDLDRLAAQFAADERAQLASPAPPPVAELDALVTQLEEWRRRVENDSASEMFSDAAGFAVGRVEPATLARAIDFRWLAALLRWDSERTSRWLLQSREQWLSSLEKGQIEHLITELELAPPDAPAAQRILDQWADLYRANDPDDPDTTQLAVFDQLDSLFDVDLGRERADEQVVLPFQDREALAKDLADPGDWLLLARAELGVDAPAESLEQLAAAWAKAFEKRFNVAFLRERSAATIAAWEARFQAALDQDFESMLAVAEPNQDAPPRALSLSSARLDRVDERSRYVIKDRGNRPIEVLHRPSYATVHLLTRNRERFAGFSVDDAHERVRLIEGDGRPFAEALIGDVQPQSLRDRMLENSLRREFDALRRKAERSEDETHDLKTFAALIARPDEQRGTAGIEGYFDYELAGRNGYREEHGLQDLFEGRVELDVPPEDGADLDLTLDIDLQRAALATLTRPDGDRELEQRDDEWLANPTGAIVMLTVDGDVLAAASYPNVDRGEAPRAARDTAFERTLRQPTFQPPGSVFKPFVAAWALDHVAGFNPTAGKPCEYQPSMKYPGYADVRCNVSQGHGLHVDLRDALKRSCNSYFAWLGEQLTLDDWRGLAHEFGFGEPTGIRSQGARRGLREDTVPTLFDVVREGRDQRVAACGLSIVQATPMQVARATAALATGRLSDVRIVRAVGGQEIEHRSRPLSLSRESLDFVRDAMAACAREAGGSAHAALNAGEVGLRVCAKTGSGDIASATVSAGVRQPVRKHAWLTCYFPADKPQFVLVVFVHDTTQTASHSAIWIGRQFLLQPAVKSYLDAAITK